MQRATAGQIASLHGGYIETLLLPLVVAFFAARVTEAKIFWRIATGVAVFLAALSLSQLALGWKTSGSSIVMANHYRAAGFFGHPLTLAYLVALFLPLCLDRVLRAPRSFGAWILFIAVGLIVLATLSRTIIAVAAVVLLAQAVCFLRGMNRKWLVAGAIAAAALVLATPNPVSEKFRETLSGNVDRHQGEYADDRLAFWAAHWEMVKESPIVGHGYFWTDARRQPYYQAIGLGDFPKHYGAHNQYLQLLVDGGIVGLVLALALVFNLWRFAKTTNHNQIFSWTLLLFGLGCLTQNAFYDAEVRYGLVLLLGLLLRDSAANAAY
jgi:O-antigen ligase